MLRAAAAPARVGRPFLARGPREDRIRGLLADGGAFDGGAFDGGAIDGGAFDGGAFDGGAVDAPADATADAASDFGHSVAAAKRSTDDLERSVLGAEREPVARTEQRAVRI